MANFWTGDPGGFEPIHTRGQRSIEEQRRRAAQGQGAGGAYGGAADYWYNILNNDPETFDRLFGPELRRYREQTVPGLAEQFAGMGAGALSSSGFQNALGSAGTDLSERLAAMRENLRMQASQNLFGLGEASLQPTQFYNPGSNGFLSALSSGVGAAIPGLLMGGPPGAAAGFIGGAASSLANKGISQKGSSSPYGNKGLNQVPRQQLPNFSAF